MSRASSILIALSVAGVFGGWWLMGVLVESGGERPALVQRIGSLRPARELPVLADARLRLIDSIESPGSSVWLLLGSDGAQPRICELRRRSDGSVEPPGCAALPPELAARAESARFASGGLEPMLMVPDKTAALGALAVNARTGRRAPVVTGPMGLALSAQPGTRRVRSFRLSYAGPRQSELVRTSPDEGHYVGPVTAFAASQPPLSQPGGAHEQTWSCATPAGYVLARLPGPSASVALGQVEVTVSFVSRAEVIAESNGQLPALRTQAAPMACGTTSALFTSLTGHRLTQVSCSPEACQRKDVNLDDIEAAQVLGIGRVGDNSVVLWRDREGRPLVRLGPLERFRQSPTAPVWQPEAGERWEHLALLSTGHSLLWLVRAQGLKLVQIHADGRLEALAPEPGGASLR